MKVVSSLWESPLGCEGPFLHFRGILYKNKNKLFYVKLSKEDNESSSMSLGVLFGCEWPFFALSMSVIFMKSVNYMKIRALEYRQKVYSHVK